jgi:EpsI family protein
MSEVRGILLVVLLALTWAIARPVEPHAAAPVALEALPLAFAGWSGIDDDSLDQAAAEQLGADAYLTRTYTTPAAPAEVGLYVAYYASQRPGVSIHSPLHCLPGAGWEALDVRTVAVPGGAAPGSPQSVEVRQMTMRKNLDQAVVIYWYQLQGRAVANEVKSKLLLLGSSLRRQPAHAALVRVVVPVADRPDAAAALGLSFVGELLPRLAPVL